MREGLKTFFRQTNKTKGAKKRTHNRNKNKLNAFYIVSLWPNDARTYLFEPYKYHRHSFTRDVYALSPTRPRVFNGGETVFTFVNRNTTRTARLCLLRCNPTVTRVSWSPGPRTLSRKRARKPPPPNREFAKFSAIRFYNVIGCNERMLRRRLNPVNNDETGVTVRNFSKIIIVRVRFALIASRSETPKFAVQYFVIESTSFFFFFIKIYRFIKKYGRKTKKSGRRDGSISFNLPVMFRITNFHTQIDGF